MKNLVYINLSQNNLSTLPEEVFQNNTAIEELNLSYNSIDFLPMNIFKNTNLAILHINHNEFSSKPNFLAPELQRLYFAYNNIRAIDVAMFKPFTSLDTLDLHGNNIQKMHNSAFADLKELKNIDLSFNDLTVINPTIFLANDKLDSIKLNDNPRLSRLPEDGFLSYSSLSKSLYHLDVSNCDILELSENTFASMPSLNTLNLSGNNLRSIDNMVFTALSKLVDLDLSFNAIEFIDNGAFSQNLNLRKLKISYNRLDTMPSKIVRGLRNLNELDISGNNLETVWAESSEKSGVALNLKNLVYFNVSFNNIKTVYLTDVQIMPSVTVLDIKHNPLECNTNFQQVLKYVAKKHISSNDPSRGRPYASYKIQTDDVLYVRDPDLMWEDLAKRVCVPAPDDDSTNEDNDDEYYNDDDNDEEDEEVEEEEQNISSNNKKTTKQNIDSINIIYDSTESSESVESNEDNDDDDDNNIRDKEILIGREIDYVQRMGERILYGSGAKQEARGHYLWPIIIIVCTVIAVLLTVARVISIITHRRGERYRQALLQSKNSIIYQKLTEDLPPQMPKVHRYMPVEQV